MYRRKLSAGPRIRKGKLGIASNHSNPRPLPITSNTLFAPTRSLSSIGGNLRGLQAYSVSLFFTYFACAKSITMKTMVIQNAV